MDATRQILASKKDIQDAIPELGRELQVSLTNDSRRLRSRFIGSDFEGFWIVSDPYVDLEKPLPDAGTPVVVRFRQSGAVYGFTSPVLLRTGHPAPLLFLATPESIERNLLRATPRINCQLPCAVAVDEFELQGRVLDISSAGCQCELRLPPGFERVPFRSGEELVVTIRLPGIAYEQHVWGEVKNIRLNGYRVQFGLAFDELDVVAQGRLSEFLSSLADA